MRTVNRAALDLIKSMEGCRLDSYQDSVGVWTIGYGHTGPDVGPDMTETQEDADADFEDDINKFAQGVEALIGNVPTTDNQFGAMVSLAYNVGLGNFRHSSVLSNHLDSDYTSAAASFRLWNKAGGQVLAGLVRRRAAEAALYKTP